MEIKEVFEMEISEVYKPRTQNGTDHVTSLSDIPGPRTTKTMILDTTDKKQSACKGTNQLRGVKQQKDVCFYHKRSR